MAIAAGDDVDGRLTASRMPRVLRAPCGASDARGKASPRPLMRPPAAPVIFFAETPRRSLRIGAFRSLTGRPEGDEMDSLTTTSPVHCYDTRQRLILCGLRGFDHRSTKHPRRVTCPACLALLRKPSAVGAPRASEAPAVAVG